jgi:hypothetical protein
MFVRAHLWLEFVKVSEKATHFKSVLRRCANLGLAAPDRVRAAGFPGGFDLFLRPYVRLGLFRV